MGKGRGEIMVKGVKERRMRELVEKENSVREWVGESGERWVRGER